MGTDKIEVLVGLDSITDYSENFEDGKEENRDKRKGEHENAPG
jgi:hypothetical protein